MFNRNVKLLSQAENIFETMYRLVKAKNKEALKSVMTPSSQIFLNHFLGEYNTVMLLAKEGNHDAIEFILKEFFHLDATRIRIWGDERESALCGYAMGGYFQRVNQMLDEGGSILTAIKGYARGGFSEQVNELFNRNIPEINLQTKKNTAVKAYAAGGYIHEVNKLISEGADIADAAEGYACGGYREQVNQLMDNNKSIGILNSAAKGYARGGYFDEVNQLIKKGANRRDVTYEYAASGFLRIENGLPLLASTDDILLRNDLINLPYEDSLRLHEEAKKFNRIMKTHQISFSEAKALSTKGARAWLLQGPQLVNDGLLPKDIFLEIATFVMSLPTEDTKKILAAVNKKLFSDCAEHAISQFKGGFFSIENYKEQVKQAAEGYDVRMKF